MLAKYEALIEQLTEIQRRAAARKTDALTASHDALCAVIGFLHADTRVAEREAARPLNQLQFAVLDRLRGAKPKLLFSRRNRKRRTDLHISGGSSEHRKLRIFCIAQGRHVQGRSREVACIGTSEQQDQAAQWEGNYRERHNTVGRGARRQIPERIG